MSANSTKKKDPVEVAIVALCRIIFNIFKTSFFGAKRLKDIKLLLAFFCTLAISGYIYLRHDWIFGINAPVYIQWLIYVFLLVIPILFLMGVGIRQMQTSNALRSMFADIGFMGKDKKYPALLYSKEDGKKEIFAFKSNIPIGTWQKSIPELETAMDCNILKIEPLDSKKKVRLTTVSTDYTLPEKIQWKDEYIDQNDGVIVIGENALEQIKFDLNRTPHVLAAGETGSGKSVILHTMLWQMAKKGAVLFMLDFKGGVEFGLKYEEYGEVITDRKKAVKFLELLVQENEKRMLTFHSMDVKTLKEYNEMTGAGLSRIGVFCDEIAEMLDKRGSNKEDKEIMERLEGYLSTLARLSRATGINLFLGIQRPDATVLTGQIKTNVPVRICGRFSDKSASEIVLGNTQAADLPDVKGRFLYKSGADTVEFQAYYFDDKEMLDEISGHEQRVMVPALVKGNKKRDELETFAEAEIKAEQQQKRAQERALNLDY